MKRAIAFASALGRWYRSHRRDLPWRRSRDPYAIWVSEIMLQQTRVETVIPYYERFLAAFPTFEELARAAEPDLLAMWAGLGYYSRVRNMQRAARRMAEAGGFPSDYQAIRALPGVGEYTAAAVVSIAFGQPYAALDGNVMRVMARISNETGDIRTPIVRKRLLQAATARLDMHDPGTYNQAVMELGATLCSPKNPQCRLCPVERLCSARQQGNERELPVKARGQERRAVEVTLLIVTSRSRLLLWQRPAESRRMAGFWELPEPGMLRGAELLETLGAFRHGIANTSYTFTVRCARLQRRPPGLIWVHLDQLEKIALSTASRKALACLI